MEQLLLIIDEICRNLILLRKKEWISMKKYLILIGLMTNLAARNFAIVKNETNKELGIALGLKWYGWAIPGNDQPIISFKHSDILQKIQQAMPTVFNFSAPVLLQQKYHKHEVEHYKLPAHAAVFIDTNIYCPDEIRVDHMQEHTTKKLDTSRSCNNVFVISQDKDTTRISAYDIHLYSLLLSNHLHGLSFFTDTLASRDGITGLKIAASDDGKKFTYITKEHPEYILQGQKTLFPLIGQKVFRDPSMARGTDGNYHLAWSASWGKERDGGAYFGYAQSPDLIHWSLPHMVVVGQMPKEQEIMFCGHDHHQCPFDVTQQLSHVNGLENAVNAWAPEIVYLQQQQEYMIIWTSKTDAANANMIMYYITTKDFKDLDGKQVNRLFAPTYNVIDGTILQDGANYYLVYKNEDEKKLYITGPASDPRIDWSSLDNKKILIHDKSYNEGPSVTKIGNEWFVFYDHYFGTPYLSTFQHYGAYKSTDFVHWQEAKEVEIPQGTRHGSIFDADAHHIRALAQLQHEL